MTFEEAKQKLKKALTDTVRITAVETKNFIQGQMDKEKDIHNKPYEGRGYERSRQREKRVLQDRGNLKDSIEVSKIDLQTLSFTINTGTQVDDYAEIHNEGGEITVTSDMQKFFWAKFYEIAGDDRRSQNINPDAEFWRNMALKKVGDKIVIPKRAFLGVSKFLEAKIQKIAQKTFEKLL